MGNSEFMDQILSILQSQHEESKEGVGSLYIHGDLNNNTQATAVKGDMRIVAQVLGQRMDGDPGFRKVMMSLFGGYLISNPEAKQEFLQGLQINNNFFSVN